MKRLSILVCVIAMAFAAGNAAFAQIVPPGGSQFNPSLPPPPPSPKIEVPVVPQLDAPPSDHSARTAPRPSFSDRINYCLDQAAAAGLGPSDREAYSRSCAN
jgi:hypothetical protein